MTVNEAAPLLLAAAAGLLLGAFFFGGLLWTVRVAVSSQSPALWFFASLLLRMSIALAGFYLVSGGHGQRLLLCLLGFAAARLVVTRLSRPPADRVASHGAEGNHAP